MSGPFCSLYREIHYIVTFIIVKGAGICSLYQEIHYIEIRYIEVWVHTKYNGHSFYFVELLKFLITYAPLYFQSRPITQCESTKFSIQHLSLTMWYSLLQIAIFQPGTTYMYLWFECTRNSGSLVRFFTYIYTYIYHEGFSCVFVLMVL